MLYRCRRNTTIVPPAIITCFAILILAVGGCAQRTEVAATPRKSQSQPEFLETSPEPASSADANTTVFKGIDFSFLRRQHFGIAAIRPGDLQNNPALKSIAWTDIESMLSRWVGEKNSKLQNIERLWVVLDSENLSMLTGPGDADRSPPILLFVDYRQPIDSVSFDEASATRQSLSPADVDNGANVESIGPDDTDEHDSAEADAPRDPSSPSKEWTAAIANERRLVLGPKSMIENWSNSDPQISSQQQANLESMDWNRDLVCIVWVSPIRSTLQGLANMVSQFSQQSGPLIDLPQALQNLTVQADLDNQQSFATVDIELNDEGLARELAKMIADALQASESPIGLNGNRASAEAMENLMFQPRTLAALESLVSEVQKSNLISVRNRSQAINLSMRRPESLVQLIEAIVTDANRQQQLAERIDKLEKIGRALQAYNQSHGHLPHPGLSDAAEPGPVGFSWRVAILPELGYQQLYDEFHFSERWDSPHNRKVAEQIPEEFRMGNGTQTRWRVFTGPDGAFQVSDEEPPTLDRITDRKIWTALVVESSPENAAEWTAPGGISGTNRITDTFGMPDENGVLMLNASFQVRAVKKKPEKIQAVLSRSGGESLSRQDFLRLE